MTFYTPSVAVDPMQAASSIISQPTSQALVLANPKYVLSFSVSRGVGALIAGINR